MFQQVQKENSSPSQTLIQPQLEIGKEDDVHEKEAEHVADKVMRMPDSEDEKNKMPESKPLLQKMKENPALMKMPESIPRPKMQESGLKIQKQSMNSSAGITAPQQVEQGINASKGSGQSLSPGLQQEMGNKMNADFSDVKIHSDENAAEMNKEVSAKAFTHGNDIYFNSGQYKPSSNEGKHLLAHELTHTVQQGTFNTIQRQPDYFHSTTLTISDDINFITIYDLQKNIIQKGKPVKNKDGSYLFNVNISTPGAYVVILETAKNIKELRKFVAIEKGEFHLNLVKSAPPKTPEPVSMEVTGDYHPAKNFTDLIDLVKIAEKKLKTAGQDIRTRIKTFRGIFYGTTWSFDYKKAEGSAMRNLGFTYFLYGPDAILTGNNMVQGLLGNTDSVEPDSKYIPMNPTAILGGKLYDALFNSYEVTNSDGRLVDFGHLIIGMEARLSKDNKQEQKELIDARYYKNPYSSTPKPMGGTGLELTTWVGDLGGGTGLLAQKRVSDVNTPAKTVFEDQHSYGAGVNLEGDIAAFVIGIPEKATTPYGLVIDENLGVAGALLAYLSPSKASSSWNDRAKDFLSLYGGKFNSSNELINKGEMIKFFANKISKFAYFYKETRIKDEANKKQSTNKLSDKEEATVDEQMKKITAQIPNASNDVATLFVSALLNVVKDPSKTIAP
ncbi:MAG: hypothetical protein JWP12_3227 [Bacteroidetes bacterium]|nr:hypothetical protein [Bacteroidota bacterium]